jgi:hypothetical protein
MISSRRWPSCGSHGTLGNLWPIGGYYRSPVHAMWMLLDTIAPERLTDGLIIDAGAGDGRLIRPRSSPGSGCRGSSSTTGVMTASCRSRQGSTSCP